MRLGVHSPAREKTMQQPFHMARGDALLIIDVQADFTDGGALAVPGSELALPVLKEWLGSAKRSGVPVIASRDWHPLQHSSFVSQGGEWPIHCVQDSSGAAFHPSLDYPPDVVKVSKGTRLDKDQYSAFDDTGLAEYLRNAGIRRLWIGGLALDVCVRATVLDALRLDFTVVVISDGTSALSKEGGAAAIEEMRGSGAQIISQSSGWV